MLILSYNYIHGLEVRSQKHRRQPHRKDQQPERQRDKEQRTNKTTHTPTHQEKGRELLRETKRGARCTFHRDQHECISSGEQERTSPEEKKKNNNNNVQSTPREREREMKNSYTTLSCVYWMKSDPSAAQLVRARRDVSHGSAPPPGTWSCRSAHRRDTPRRSPLRCRNPATNSCGMVAAWGANATDRSSRTWCFHSHR
jgi:hypothetical protein